MKTWEVVSYVILVLIVVLVSLKILSLVPPHSDPVLNDNPFQLSPKILYHGKILSK